MHRRLGNATLSQLVFPGEGNLNFTWEKSHWDNTVVKKYVSRYWEFHFSLRRFLSACTPSESLLYRSPEACNKLAGNQEVMPCLICIIKFRGCHPVSSKNNLFLYINLLVQFSQIDSYIGQWEWTRGIADEHEKKKRKRRGGERERKEKEKVYRQTFSITVLSFAELNGRGQKKKKEK